MTQEDKDLLLKDLCARLSYGVKCSYKNKSIYSLTGIDLEKYTYIFITHNDGLKICEPEIKNIKPYLFPLSSMTEEQKYDFYCRFIENDCDFDDFKEFYLDNGMWHKMLTSIDDCDSVVDWFNKYHFDFRGLIPMGLANDATRLNIY